MRHESLENTPWKKKIKDKSYNSEEKHNMEIMLIGIWTVLENKLTSILPLWTLTENAIGNKQDNVKNKAKLNKTKADLLLSSTTYFTGNVKEEMTFLVTCSPTL